MTPPCFECEKPSEHQHHVVPQSRGGKKTIPLCRPCHAKVHELRESWGKPRELHPVEFNNILDLARAGCSAKSISDDMGLNYIRVRKIIKDAGIELKAGRPSKKSSVAGAPTGRHGVSDVSLRIAQRSMKAAMSKQLADKGIKTRY